MTLITKWSGNPILGPDPALPWGRDEARNPGAVWDGEKIRMVFTAMTRSDGGGDMVLGYADSTDGFHFTARPEPFMDTAHGAIPFDRGSLEDTRITPLDGSYYIAYAGRSESPRDFWFGPHPNWDPKVNPTWSRNFRRVGLAVTNDWRRVERLGPVTSEELSDANVVLFPERLGGKFAMLHRPTPFLPGAYQCLYSPAAIWLAFSNDLLDWGWREDLAHESWPERLSRLADDHLLIAPQYEWERLKIGAAGVPIATDDGWLMLYHAVDRAGVYRAGLLLLDRADPRRVLARSPRPVLEPETPIEKGGHYTHGDGCVFPCANIVIGDDVFIYYGAADKYCCVATVKLKALLDYALSCRVA